MNIYRVLLITGLFLFLHCISFAQQQKLPKTLLWKISGRGLSQPSYLFGTMHLTDKRLFRLDDSVFHSISATQGFAMEINPEELAAYMVNEMLNDLENKQKLENILDPEDFRKHKKALSKKFKKDPDEITVSDVVQEKNKWVNEFMAKGEMPTMLDAYLYNMARKQGKWIGGIEDLVDQAGLQEGLVDVTDVEYLLSEYNSDALAKKQLETMIRIYSEGDLAGIEALVSGSQTEKVRDAMLIKRNVKMARRMDSLSAIRTMFFAVGAAHLPGDSGVIDLLRKRGFDVAPVFSKNKIDAAAYKYQEKEIPWINVRDKQDLYTAMMPGNPVEFKQLGIVDMKFHMDLFSLTGYLTMATATPMNVAHPDSVFQMMAKSTFKGKKASKPLVIDSAGVLGREYVQEVDNVNMRIRLYLHNNIFYMAGTFHMKKDKSITPDIKKFFNSFVINRTIGNKTGQLYTFTDSIFGIQLESAAELTYNEKMSNRDGTDWRVATFTGADLSTGAFIFLIVKDAVPGAYILSDSAVLHQMFNHLEYQYGNLKKTETTIHGYPALLLEGKNIANEKFTMKMITLVRGNRNIVVMELGQDNYFEQQGRKLIESIRLIPYKSHSWKNYSDSTNTFTSWSPAPFHWKPNTYTGIRRSVIYSYDSVTALSYTVVLDTINSYYSFRNDSIHWNPFQRNLDARPDSLISVKEISNGNMNGREYIVRKNNSNVYQRMRSFIYGNYYINLLVLSRLNDLYDDNVQRFFNNFRMQAPAGDFNITVSKSGKLLEDLLSDDSITRENAAEALTVVDFYEEDTTFLKAALLKKYITGHQVSGTGHINDLLAQKLAKLNPPGLIDFARKSYVQQNDDGNRKQLLYLLGQLKTKESTAAMGTLMSEVKPVTELEYGTYGDLYDSLDLAFVFVENTRSLRKDSVYGPLIASLYVTLLDSNRITREQFLEAEKDFIAMVNTDLNAGDSIQYLMGNSWDNVLLLGKIKTSAAVKALNRYLADDRKFIRKLAALQLLKAGQKVNADVIQKLAADAETRLDLYNELKEIKKESLFPAAYRNQKSFSESELYNLDDDISILSTTYVGTKTTKVKGKLYRFHLWKVKIETDEDPVIYLAVTGGYPVAVTDIAISQQYSGIQFSKPFKESLVTALFNEYIEALEAETEE